jgi:PAS domain S-box-containing protein
MKLATKPAAPALAAKAVAPRRSVAALQHQLLMYAQDLNDLMVQQNLLQRRYQMALQSQGRSNLSEDVLINGLRQSDDLHIVTDCQGEICHASCGAQRALGPMGPSLKGRFIWQHTHPSQVATVNALLAKCAGVGATGCAVQHKLVLLGDTRAQPVIYDVLALPVRSLDRMEIFWLLSPESQAQQGEIDIQRSILKMDSRSEGLIIADANSVVRAVNPAFSKITGYTAADMIGENPRLLSSGRQDGNFYRSFWAYLRGIGVWTGELINRKKDGSLYTDWKTVRAVKNARDEVISYIAAFVDISPNETAAGQSVAQVEHDAHPCVPQLHLTQKRAARDLGSAMHCASNPGSESCGNDAAATDQPANDLGFELWRALERREMYLLYQPQGTPSEPHKLRGCEVILRWQNARFGEVSPSTFIALAEKSGAIREIGFWVLETACRQLSLWQKLGLRYLTMSVNVTARQLQDPNFFDRTTEILLASGVDPHLLELELSVSDALLHLQDERSRLVRLREMGVHLAIADFGAGDNSISRLLSLPIDRLKIDGTCLRDLTRSGEARAITDSFVGIAHAMSLSMTAVGVEELAQAKVLAAQGYDLIQGNFLAKPMTAQGLQTWALADSPKLLS